MPPSWVPYIFGFSATLFILCLYLLRPVSQVEAPVSKPKWAVTSVSNVQDKPPTESRTSKPFYLRTIGHIEKAFDIEVSGWACIQGIPDHQVVLSLTVDGQSCGHGYLNIRRDDVYNSVPVECDLSSYAGFQIRPSCNCQQCDAKLSLMVIGKDTERLDFRDISGSQTFTLKRYFVDPPPAPKTAPATKGQVLPASVVNYLGHRRQLPIRLDPKAPRRINLLMTGLGKDLTGGPLNMLHFAMKTSESGFPVRWINIDGVGIRKEEMFAHLKNYHGLEKFDKMVEFVWDAFHVLEDIVVNPHDFFMGTVWFTGIMAYVTQRKLVNPNILYFIQDYETIFFPGSTLHLEALESYTVPHFPIFNSNFLQIYFHKNRMGLYSCCNRSLSSPLSWVSQPAVHRHPPLNLTPPDVQTLIAWTRVHAERNAYDLVLATLSEAVRRGAFDQGRWRFIGVGAVRDIGLYCGLGGRPDVCIDIKGNVPEPQYLEIIRSGDVGLSLMVTPQITFSTLDFASAGMVTVTNSYDTKTPELYGAVSKNILVVKPYFEDIVAGLHTAVARSRNRTARQKNAILNWASDWSDERCYGATFYKRLSLWFNFTKPVTKPTW